MNRRKFFQLFGGAVAAAMLPLGALALPQPKKRFENFVDITFTPNDQFLSLAEFEERILNPALQRLAVTIDAEFGGLLK